MNPLSLVLFSATLGSLPPLCAAEAPSVKLPSGYALSWSDEFNGSSLDMEKWFYRQPGPRHDAVNTEDAVSVGSGMASIRTYSRDGKHYTGMIATRQDRGARPYGFYEASIQFTGDRRTSSGMWSAFWLQSGHVSTVGNTGKYGTEIDIVEYRARPNDGKEVNQAIHYHGYGKNHRSASKLHQTGLLKGFHTYGVLWTAGGYTFYMDGREVWKTSEALSCIPQYIILSSEIRDKNWAGNIPEDGYGAKDKSAAAMNVDYVRIYSLPDSRRMASSGTWSDSQWLTSLPSGKGNTRRTVVDGANVWVEAEGAASLLLDRNAVVDSLTVGNGKTFHLSGRDKTLTVRSGIAALDRSGLIFDVKISLKGSDSVWTLFEEGSTLSANGPVSGEGNLALRTGSGKMPVTFRFHAPVTLKGNLDVEGEAAIGKGGRLSVSGKTVFRRNSCLSIHLDGREKLPGLNAAGGLELEENVRLNPEFAYTPRQGETVTLVSASGKPVKGTFRELPEGKEFSAGNVRLRIHYTKTGISLKVLSVKEDA